MARMKNFFPDQSKFKVNVFFQKVVPVEANLVGQIQSFLLLGLVFKNFS